MTGEVADEPEIDDPARIVRMFLDALHEEDWGTAVSAIEQLRVA